MGGIVSKPKVPAPPPLPPAPPPPAPEPEVQIEETPEPTIAEKRVENVLKRRRGRLGTIATSFRGVLSANGLAPTRKTLLGE